MKSVNFWLPANLIKHVDEAFRGAAQRRRKETRREDLLIS